MTVVVAGYETDFPFSFAEYAGVFDETPIVNEPTVAKLEKSPEDIAAYRAALASPTEAFVMSDSLLSRDVGMNQRMGVASQAAKIFHVPIEISIPYFAPNGVTTGRYQMHLQFSCGVAYAGSSMVCHQVVERFRTEMSMLRYTWISAGFGRPGNYAICRAGTPEDIGAPRPDTIAYEDDIDFAHMDMPPLHGELTAEVFEACFNAVLADHLPKEDTIQNHPPQLDFQVEFVLLTYCLHTKAPTVYIFGWTEDQAQFPVGFKATVERLHADDLAVLGHSSWRDALLAAREASIAEGRSPSSGIRKRLRELIAENQANNYVGGKVQSGQLGRKGFELQPG